jgi:hypothetical protein
VAATVGRRRAHPTVRVEDPDQQLLAAAAVIQRVHQLGITRP